MKYSASNLSKARKLFSASLIVLVTASCHIYAAEQQVGWSISSRHIYDDNPRLRSEEKESISGVHIKPEVSYQYFDGINKVSTETLYTKESFNRTDYDFEGYSASLNFEHARENNTFSTEIETTRRPTRVTELDESGISGNVASARDNHIVSLGWRSLINENQILDINASAQKTEYESENIADYEFYGIQATWHQVLSESFTGVAQLNYSYYDAGYSDDFALSAQLTSPGQITTKSETYGAMLGFDWQITERLSWDTLVGTAEVETKQLIDIETQQLFFFPDFSTTLGGKQETEDDSDTLLFDTSAHYALEPGAMSLSFSRRTRASGNGALREDNDVRFTYSHYLTELSQLKAKIYVGLQKSLSDETLSISRDDRRYVSAEVSYSHKITQSISAIATIRHRSQEYPDRIDNDRAESLSGLLEIRYQPNHLFW